MRTEPAADLGSLFDQPVESTAIVGHVGPTPGATLYDDFLRFHAENPQVYAELVRLARRLNTRGVRHFGIGMLYEVLRYRTALRTKGDEFKLNNNHRSYYARLIVRTERDLRGCFELRELHARMPRELDPVPHGAST